MKFLIIIIALTLVTLGTARAEVTYHIFNGDVVGSDGSRSHHFGSYTTTTRPGYADLKCHEFAGTIRCEGGEPK